MGAIVGWMKVTVDLVGVIVGHVVVTVCHIGVTVGWVGVIVGSMVALSGLLGGRFGRASFPRFRQAQCHPSPSLHAMERI